MNRKVVIGLPAYNEEENIGKLLDKISLLEKKLGESLSVIIVNDGSSDGTEKVLKRYSTKYGYINYINHPKNKGLNKAIETLLYYAVNNYSKDDIFITLDSDNTHNPNIIIPMINKLIKERLDIVIASRFVKGGKEIGLSSIRKIYSRGAKLFCKIVFPIKNVNDYSCGFRAYSIGFLNKLIALYEGNLITARGFECMVEILAKAGKIGANVGEYPLILEYNLKNGESKMNAIETIKGYFRLAFTIKSPLKEIDSYSIDSE